MKKILVIFSLFAFLTALSSCGIYKEPCEGVTSIDIVSEKNLEIGVQKVLKNWSSINLNNKGKSDNADLKDVKSRKPKWLKVKLPTGEAYKKVREITKSRNLHTICESGNCPNMGECWGAEPQLL